MIIEESLPEKFKISAYNPTLFIYAFKKNVLEKLFDEVMQSNIAILGGEAWIAEGNSYFGVIPLKNGDKTVLSWKIKRKEGEDWFDFVERSVKESMNTINEAGLEKLVTAGIRNKLWYHFEFKQE